MKQVKLTIGGRKYTVSCDPGQEGHIAKLGESIDAKLQQMGNPSAPDSQNMLFAALFLADELHETKASLSTASANEQNALKQKIADQEAELAKLRAESEKLTNQAASTRLSDDPNLAPALERFADLLENCADKLEGKAATS